MALQTVNLGTYANDGTGDDLRTAFEKVNANTTELNTVLVKGGKNLGSGSPVFYGLSNNPAFGKDLDFRSIVGGNNINVTHTTDSITVTAIDSINHVEEDTAPKLGGNLLLNGFNITGLGNINIEGVMSAQTYTGDVVGNLQGNVTGNVTGNLLGDVTGNVTGDVVGNLLGNVVGNITGNLEGNVTGNVTGHHTGDVTGNVTGNVTGILIGNVVGTVSDISNHNLAALTDVSYNSAQLIPGQALVWSGSTWTNGDSGTGGGGGSYGGGQGVQIDFGSFLTPYTLPFDFGTFTTPNTLLTVDGNLSSGVIIDGLKIVGTTVETLNGTDSINFNSNIHALAGLTISTIVNVSEIKLHDNVLETFQTNTNLLINSHGTGHTVIDGLTYPKTDGQPGQVLGTNGTGQLVWSDVVAGFTGNYNDLTNKPTIPTTIFDLGITDGTSNQVLKTDGAGHLSWTTITGFSGNYNDLTNKPTIPTTIFDLGITDGTSNQVLKTDGAGHLSWITISTNNLGNITVSGSTLNTTDPAIVFTPTATFNGTVNVSTNLNVTNTVTAAEFTSTATGVPTISSSTNINLDAVGKVDVVQGPIRMARFTTSARNAILAQNGDMIYNTDTNKFQGYANGAWVDLH